MQHRQALWCSARADARRAHPKVLLRWAATRCDDAEFSLLAQPAGLQLLRGGLERLRPREAVRLELARVAAVDALAPVVVRLRDARVVTNARHARTVRGAGRVEAVL